MELSGAAKWAFFRIIELHPEQAARLIGEVASSLAAPERVAVAEALLRYPALDATGVLLERLSENLDRIPKQDFEPFVPLLLTAMIAAKGRAGAELARAVLRRNGSLLSRKTRRDCEELIDASFAGELVPPPLPEPPQWTVYDICAGNAVWQDDEEEDEEDFAPPEPAQRKYTPGRNDPCWCGSGKKYKKCHLEADERPEERPPALRGEFDAMRNRLGKFLMDAVPQRESRQGLEEFFGSGHSDEEEQRRDTPALIDWMMHDWVPPNFGRTVMQEFLHRHGSSLTPREREFVESSARSSVRLYEVQSVKEGSGIEVKDLISAETFFVHDVSISKRIIRWEGLLARVVDGERGHEFSGVGLTVPRMQLEQFRQWMAEDRRRTGMPWPEYFKRNLPRIRRRPDELRAEWLETIEVRNGDGEVMLFSKAVYRIRNAAAVIAALQSCSELAEDENGKEYTWLTVSADREEHTVLGNIRLDGAELVCECNSKERLERAKELLATLAGPALQHQRDEFTTQQELKRRAGEKPRAAKPEEPEIPPEVRDEIITEAMNKHYAKWLDMELPALDGKTPRQAVKTASGRRKVSKLLRDIENGEERKRRAGEAFFDVSRLRAELGVAE